MISSFNLVPARVPGLFPYLSFLSFLRKRISSCSIVIFYLLLVPGSGACLPSFLSFLFSGMGHPMTSLLRMNVVETWFVAVWGLCWCNLHLWNFLSFNTASPLSGQPSSSLFVHLRRRTPCRQLCGPLFLPINCLSIQTFYFVFMFLSIDVTSKPYSKSIRRANTSELGHQQGKKRNKRTG